MKGKYEMKFQPWSSSCPIPIPFAGHVKGQTTSQIRFWLLLTTCLDDIRYRVGRLDMFDKNNSWINTTMCFLHPRIGSDTMHPLELVAIHIWPTGKSSIHGPSKWSRVSYPRPLLLFKGSSKGMGMGRNMMKG